MTDNIIKFPKTDRYKNWNKIIVDDPDTLPKDGSDITYRFHPCEDFDSEWDGQYEDGVFFSNGGFCDINDVTHWKYK